MSSNFSPRLSLVDIWKEPPLCRLWIISQIIQRISKSCPWNPVTIPLSYPLVFSTNILVVKNEMRNCKKKHRKVNKMLNSTDTVESVNHNFLAENRIHLFIFPPQTRINYIYTFSSATQGATLAIGSYITTLLLGLRKSLKSLNT